MKREELDKINEMYRFLVMCEHTLRQINNSERLYIGGKSFISESCNTKIIDIDDALKQVICKYIEEEITRLRLALGID